MRLRKTFTPHTVTVRDRLGGGSMGERHGPPRTVADVWVVDEQSTILDAAGNEVVSGTQVSTNLDEIIPLGSLVTVWQGEPGEREGRVEKISVFRHQRLPQSRTLFIV